MPSKVTAEHEITANRGHCRKETATTRGSLPRRSPPRRPLLTWITAKKGDHR